MGFMGLSHWADSDNAADFKSELETRLWEIVLSNTDTQREIKNLIDSELSDEANKYNTPGPINIALLVEADIIPKSVLTKKQVQLILQKLKRYRETYKPSLHKDLDRLIKTMESRAD